MPKDGLLCMLIKLGNYVLNFLVTCINASKLIVYFVVYQIDVLEEQNDNILQKV